MTTPQHKHSGDGTFLGQFTSDYTGKTVTFDLWFEPQPVFGPTVIARFGPLGAYYSGMSFAQPYVDITGADQPGIPMLVEARRRAIEQGLIDA